MSRTTTTGSDTAWTTQRLLSWMRERFEHLDLDAPRVVAEMLLAHVIGCERLRLYMEVDREATPDELERLRALVRRACADEPVQYLVGEAAFFSSTFEVNDSTLIPQPCTEELIAVVLEHCRPERRAVEATPTDDAVDEDEPAAAEPAPLRIADIGTGTGCIAISLARQLPHATFVATDIVPEALELAQRNAERHGVADRIEFREGNALEPLDEEFDVVCSNPPYISDAEWGDGSPGSGEVQACVRAHVPETATRGGS